MQLPTSIKKIISKYPGALFLGSWFLLNLLQAGLTELLDDEAYYWVYSRYPAWGYFDHPPMISFLIRIGYFLFKNELGVRLLMVVASTSTLLIIQKMLPQKNDRLFYGICCSIAILQIGGIIAAPDIPLLFFTALFFLVYKNFLRQMNLMHSILLGLVIACMLYTKYHSVLVILFTLGSFPKLLTKYQTYLVAAIAILCYLPHIYWQVQNGFVSIQFQLFDRFSEKGYNPAITLEYILGQFFLPGPFAGILLIWAALARSPKDYFEKALKVNMIGFYLFFLLCTIRGRVEANWTVASLIPMMVLSHQYFNDNPRFTKWIFRFVPVTLIAVFLVRIYLIVDTSSIRWIKTDEMHGNHPWTSAIQKKAGGLPVIFINSYQNASKYWFYSGQASYSLNTPAYRRNNYSLWPGEDSLFHRSVFLVGSYDPVHFNDSLPTAKGSYGAMRIPDYASFSRINLKIADGIHCVDGKVQPFELSVSMFGNHYPRNSIPRPEGIPVKLWVTDRSKIQRVFETGIYLNSLDEEDPGLTAPFNLELPAGKYVARLCLPSAVPGNPTVNSTYINLEVAASARK